MNQEQQTLILQLGDPVPGMPSQVAPVSAVPKGREPIKPLNTILVGAAILVGLSIDFGRFHEAGPFAYYQARVAYARGSDSVKHRIADAMGDGTLSVHDYMETIWPAYLHLAKEGEDLFPGTEQGKPIEVQRAALAAIVRR